MTVSIERFVLVKRPRPLGALPSYKTALRLNFNEPARRQAGSRYPAANLKLKEHSGECPRPERGTDSPQREASADNCDTDRTRRFRACRRTRAPLPSSLGGCLVDW